jgi:hypothetical protein
MKPFFVMAMLFESSVGTDRPEVLDAYLMEHGRQLDKRVFGLETMKEQVAAVDALPVKEQAKALLAHLRSDGAAEMNELLDAYARQDLDLLLRLMAESPSMPSGLQQSLIVQRNRVMAHRMDSVLRVDGPSMFMVGAGHLPGKEGVIEQLRARGYTVAPVDMSASVPWDLDQPSLRMDGWIHYTNDSLGFAVDMPSKPTVSEWGGTLLVRPVKDDGGLTVMVEDLPSGEDTTLDQLVEERFFDQDLSITELVHWDIPARLITRTAGELEHASLLMVHSERIYLLMTGARPPIENLNIIASFRFPAKPE